LILFHLKIDPSPFTFFDHIMASYWFTLILISMYLTIFSIGCWEANMALYHEPTPKSSPGFIHGYIYTIFACVTNIMVSIILLCTLGLHDPKQKENDSSHSPFTFILAIWSIVLFAGMIDHDIRTGPFQSVVIAQFIITMGSALLCCGSCMVRVMIDP